MIVNIANLLKKYLKQNGYSKEIYVNQLPFDVKNEFLSIIVENENIDFVIESIVYDVQFFIVGLNANNAIWDLNFLLNILKHNYDIKLKNEDETKEYFLSGLYIKYISHIGVNEKNKYEIAVNAKLYFNYKNL